MISKIYPCVYCTEDGHCEKYSDEEATSWCVLGPCKDEKPSNADRIRAMSDEELAWAYAYRLTSCYECEASTIEDCVKCMRDWLKQEGE